jgi:cysteine synthase
VHARQAFRTNQFKLEGNFRTHYLHIGPEILSQSKNQIQAFATLSGRGHLRWMCGRLYGSEPSDSLLRRRTRGAPVLAGQPVRRPNHRIQGSGNSMQDLKFVKPESVDGYLQVSDDEAGGGTRRLVREGRRNLRRVLFGSQLGRRPSVASRTAPRQNHRHRHLQLGPEISDHRSVDVRHEDQKTR